MGDLLKGPEFGFVGMDRELGQLGNVAKSGGVESAVKHEANSRGGTGFKDILGAGVVLIEGGVPEGSGATFGAQFGSRGMWLGR